MYKIKPLEFEERMPSQTVFLLCDNSKNPFELFLKECSDSVVAGKMAKSLEMVDRIGLSKAKQIRLLKQLKAGKSCDLYEVRTNSCTARAYSFLVERKEILVIAFIEQVTHSGTGKKGAQRAIKKLESNRHSLNEALKGYENG